jgi:hypothetical protein
MSKATQANLGDLVVDTVSGFRGIVTSITQYLHGCEQCGVQAPLMKDGKIGENYGFDRPRLRVVTAGKIKIGSRETGGPIRQLPVSTPRR